MSDLRLLIKLLAAGKLYAEYRPPGFFNRLFRVRRAAGIYKIIRITDGHWYTGYGPRVSKIQTIGPNGIAIEWWKDDILAVMRGHSLKNWNKIYKEDWRFKFE